VGDVPEVSTEQWPAAVLKADTPVFVDFFATWCPPCRAVAPIVEDLAKEFAGKVAFAKLNIDNAPEIMMEYQVEGVPTLAIFKGGKEVDRQVGVPQGNTKALLKSWIEAKAGLNGK
jgi:thioredoxin